MKPLRHLSADEVLASLPPLPERLVLARTVLTAIGREAELPPKIGVHPRQPGSLADAMPALLRSPGDDPAADLIGVKWIVGMPANPARGLPTYSALVIVNDPVTGEPLGVIDGDAITAARTAAISGTVIGHLLPEGTGPGGRPARVALLGAGAQARAHVPVIGLLLPGARLLLTDVAGPRARALAGEASASVGIGSAEAVSSVRDAVDSADIVVSVVSFGPVHQNLDPAWLSPDALLIAVDYDMQAPAALARESLFIVDETGQFAARRESGLFTGYPDPAGTIGGLLRGEIAGGGRPDGRILAIHLGVGLADVVFAAAVLARAEELGLGRLLPR